MPILSSNVNKVTWRYYLLSRYGYLLLIGYAPACWLERLLLPSRYR